MAAAPGSTAAYVGFPGQVPILVVGGTDSAIEAELALGDHDLATIGGHPPIKWLRQIGVPYVGESQSWSPARTGDLVKGR